MDEVRVRLVTMSLLCIVFAASLLQVSVGQWPKMLVTFDDDDKNLVTLSCSRHIIVQPPVATFTFTNPQDVRVTELRSNSSRNLTFLVLPRNETLVSCILNNGPDVSETVAITGMYILDLADAFIINRCILKYFSVNLFPALPRYTGTATSILQYVFSDSDTIELTCPLDTGRLHGLITPYEFIWNVKLEGAQSGTVEVTNVNGTIGTFHYRDNNRLLSVNLSSLRPNVQYSFQCLGRLKRCNSSFSQNQIVCREQTTEPTNSPFFEFDFVGE